MIWNQTKFWNIRIFSGNGNSVTYNYAVFCVCVCVCDYLRIKVLAENQTKAHLYVIYKMTIMFSPLCWQRSTIVLSLLIWIHCWFDFFSKKHILKEIIFLDFSLELLFSFCSHVKVYAVPEHFQISSCSNFSSTWKVLTIISWWAIQNS